MAKNITLLGASYSNVPAVELPQTGGGTAKFTDTSVTTAVESDVASGKIFLKADGSIATGTSSGGGGGSVNIWQDGQGYVNLDDQMQSVQVVSSLNVTENGTYTAPTGYAYNPVTVTVSGGGGGVEEKQVNFIDYDGSLVESYTKAEANALNSLPTNPSHTGLTAQGWNWTLAQIKSQLTADPDGVIWVGQTYTTVSGDSEIDITLVGLMKEPYLGIAINGTVTIDWGDSTTDTVSGTSLTTQIRTKHSYASDGDYTISIHADSGSYAFFGTETYTLLSNSASSGGYNRVYSTSIRSIRIGNDASIGNYAFAHCHSLKSISIPSSITALGTYVFYYSYGLTSVTYPNTLTSTGGYDFYYCYSLKRISLPYGLTTLAAYTFSNCASLNSVTVPLSVTSIGNYCFNQMNTMEHITIPGSVTTLGTYVFNYMYSLHSVTLGEGLITMGAYDFNYDSALPAITIPSTVTSMGGSVFYACYGLGEVHMLPTTPPTLGTSAFNMASGGKIYVPSASLSDYQTAENWSSYASRMVGE